MLVSEKKLSTTSTHDTFDEIYTNFDLSVDETYSAANGYPFDYPTRWLNDPSMNKRIAIRRLDATPSSHSFKITVKADEEEAGQFGFSKTSTIDITEYDNLVKVLNHICSEFSYQDEQDEAIHGGLVFSYDNSTNELTLGFINSKGNACDFTIEDGDGNVITKNMISFLKFLNQDNIEEKIAMCKNSSRFKEFDEVWNRDRLHFHATFSTSRRKFIGKRGDFYQNLTLLYPPPTNESTFYIRMTSNGIKNILLRYCEFDVQLCFIVNYKKASVL